MTTRSAWPRTWLVVMVLALSVLLSHRPAHAADENARVMASVEDGYGRIILTFDGETNVDVRSSSSVIVVTYPDPVDFDVRKVAAQLPGYVTAARKDPDEKGVRFALAGPYRVNTIEAADRLVIDLLPDEWAGLPPGLPDFIVDELRKRADQSEEIRLQRERDARIARSQRIEVRVGTLPTFTRISFHWPEPVAAKLARDGEDVTIVFEEAAKLELGIVRARLPGWISAIETGSDERGGLKVSMKIAEDANVRGFPEGATYIVDVTNPEQLEEETPFQSTAGAASEGGAVSVDVAQPIPGEPPAAESALETEQSPLTAAAGDIVSPSELAAAEVDETADADAAGATDAGADAEPNALDVVRSESDQVENDRAEVPMVEQPEPPAARPEATRQQASSPRPGTFETAVSGPADPPASDETALPKRAELRDAIGVKVQQFGAAKRLVFPFKQKTAAAVFFRNKTLWLVFDTDEPIAAEAIMRDLNRELVDVQEAYESGKRILRIRFLRPQLVTANLNETDWFISVSDSIVNPPTPMVIDRRSNSLGVPEAIVPFETARRAVKLIDPESEETLWVVTGEGPAAALIKPQRFVEFESVTTAHGVVVRPIADDIELTIEPGLVIISSQSGLSLSGEVGRSFEAASGALGDVARPGFITVETDKMRDEKGLGAVIQEQAAAIAALPESERSAGRLRLAKLYLSADLAAEALGMLRYASEENPAIEREPSFRALYGVAKVQMGRHAEALQAFDSFKLGQSPDIALWRGLAHVGLSQWREAEVAFLDGESAVTSYSPERQLRLRIAAARSAIAAGDLQGATRFVSQAEALVGGLEDEPELLLVWGMLADRLGRHEQAVGALDKLADIDNRQVQTEALLRKTDLQLAQDEITPEDAIQVYETLALTWRGDDIELETLRSLSEVYASQREYRRAFELMKHAAISDTGSAITREIEDRMNSLFLELFIGGRASSLPPIEALALFYDFRELTPVGRQGDEMIRALADKLIEVDLLDQAAELLAHQVDNRLTGAARAQIATKLALVHMMNRKPQQALNVLARSRQAILPESLSRQRIILEARALAETGRSDLAVDLLSAVEGDDTERLAADALWRGEKWQESAETLEKLLSRTWQPGDALDETQSYDVMRTAIGYALAGDDLGSDRIRTRFGSVMSETKDALAFNIVTTPMMRNSGDFREVVRSVAAIDTLESFLAGYRARFSTGGTEADS